MSGSFQVPYTPLCKTLELTKLFESVGAFSSDVFELTSARSFFGAQAQNLTQRLRILENEVREWDNKILVFHDVIPDTVLDKLREEAQNLAAATQASHEYFKLTIRTNQEGKALTQGGISLTPPPYDVPRNIPHFDHFRMWSSSSSSSSSNSNSSFSSLLGPPIDSQSSHPAPHLTHPSAGSGSPLGSRPSSPCSTIPLVPRDWSPVSGVEHVRVTSFESQYWVRINRNSNSTNKL